VDFLGSLASRKLTTLCHCLYVYWFLIAKLSKSTCACAMSCQWDSNASNSGGVLAGGLSRWNGLINVLWCPKCILLGLVEVVSFQLLIFPAHSSKVTSSKTASSGLECAKLARSSRAMSGMLMSSRVSQYHVRHYHWCHPVDVIGKLWSSGKGAMGLAEVNLISVLERFLYFCWII
jgi:hypothetical protein